MILLPPSKKLNSIRQELSVIHLRLASNPNDHDLQKEQASLQMNLEVWLSHEEELLKQKSRESWLNLGDKNSKFFYAAMKVRNAHNAILQFIDDDGNPSTDIPKLRIEAPKFFANLSNQEHYWNVFPELIVKKKLTSSSAQWLIRPFSSAEIQTTLFAIASEKAPGPDGFSSRFFQLHWDLIGEDICKAIKYFFRKGSLVR